MGKFTVILALGYTLSVLVMFLEIWVKFSGERDILWKYEWLVESSWFSIFSLFLFAIMVLMKPNPTSKLLALVDELSDTDRASTNPS
jgi:hypothetical protein